MKVNLRRAWSICSLGLAFAVVGGVNHLSADAAAMQMKIAAPLSGAEQVPVVQTAGTGQFQGMVAGSNSISYRLSFSGLSSPVTAAHIHLGKKGANGGVIAFLCGGGGKPQCPPSGGTVTGTITAANVVATEGMKKGDLPAVIRAMMNGDTYVNVHTTKYKDGEIRGQIEVSK
jgi:CHRD domain-containing protein